MALGGPFSDRALAGASHHAVIPNVNTAGNLREIWPRLSADERRLFDVVARSYLASVMPDFRYRQTTVTMDVSGHAFRATGRQPLEFGWRAAFPDWQPAEERGEDAQMLPALRDGEVARLSDVKVEAKETRPPPRYNEGTLIDAMQNAWRFVTDETLRERLKEAKGIGTPATRGEIIGGLKAQEFLAADGKHIVPTERGLVLHDVLRRADPALVDPGVTAQMERLLDDVLVGRQDMMSAIDAVCSQASRIIERLTEQGASETMLLPLGSKAGQTRTPRVSSPRRSGSSHPKASPPQTRVEPKLDADTASSPTAFTVAKQHRSRQPLAAKKSHADCSRTGSKTKADVNKTSPHREQSGRGVTDGDRRTSSADTPLRIPYGNKQAALALGARYRAGGWYAPAGVSLAAFRERGWLEQGPVSALT